MHIKSVNGIMKGQDIWIKRPLLISNYIGMIVIQDVLNSSYSSGYLDDNQKNIYSLYGFMYITYYPNLLRWVDTFFGGIFGQNWQFEF